ncbi:MAG TPA: hypothetical protein VKY65_15205 [Alphaproteobacteria bacterium]|nr:hypothetical protein [Alphaproteobacteria bacterium]
MRGSSLRKALRRSAQGVFGAVGLVFALSLVATPAHAYWHHCWHCGPRVFIGLGAVYPPPPVYYYPPPPPYYYAPPPPVVVAPPPPVIVQGGPSCTSGKWRQEDGSIVNGVACLQPDGTWKLQ